MPALYYDDVEKRLYVVKEGTVRVLSALGPTYAPIVEPEPTKTERLKRQPHPSKDKKDTTPKRKQGKTRERVIALRVQGKTTQEIADTLGLSYSAVMYHIAKDAGAPLDNWGRSSKQDKVQTAPEDLLTEDQFDEIKHLQQIGDLSSKEFAAEHGVPLAQVNRAIASVTYRDYRDF